MKSIKCLQYDQSKAASSEALSTISEIFYVTQLVIEDQESIPNQEGQWPLRDGSSGVILMYVNLKYL